MLGTASGQAVEEMLAYAHDTQHEKIIRGLSMGIAMVMYGREEQADTLIEQLVGDKVILPTSVSAISLRCELMLHYAGLHYSVWWNVLHCSGLS